MHFAIQNLMLHTHITVQIASCKQTADKILITAKYIGSILRKHLQRTLFVVLHFIMKKYIHQGICLLYILCLCIARIILFYTILLYYNAQNATYGGVERVFFAFENRRHKR